MRPCALRFALLALLARCWSAETACSTHAIQPAAEEGAVYEFLAAHAPAPPRAVLAVGDAASAAAWAACRPGDSAATLAVALVGGYGGRSPPRRGNSTGALRVMRGRLARGGLSTLETRFKTRFDWIVMDSSTFRLFSTRLDELDDGRPRVVAVRFDAPPTKIERRLLDSHAPPLWVQLRAHDRFFAFVF